MWYTILEVWLQFQFFVCSALLWRFVEYSTKNFFLILESKIIWMSYRRFKVKLLVLPRGNFRCDHYTSLPEQSLQFPSAFVLKSGQKDGLRPFLAKKVLLEMVQTSPGTLRKNVQHFYAAWAQAEFKVLIICKKEVGISSESGAFLRVLIQAQRKLSYLLPQPNSPTLRDVALC